MRPRLTMPLPRPLALLLASLLGCAEEPSDVEPAMQADTWLTHLQASLERGIPEPTRPRDAFGEALQNGDGRCPAGPTERLSFTASFGGCEAGSGWVYAGIAEYTGERPQDAPGAPFHLLADGFAIDPEGNRFVFGGELEYIVEGDTWASEVTGSWSYAPEGAWMQDEASVAVWAEGDGEGLAWLRGGVNDGDGDVLYFDELTHEAGELGGAVEVRDTSGAWTRLDFEAGEGECGALDGGEPLCAAGLLDALAAMTQRLEAS